jgi:hypothetical protein
MTSRLKSKEKRLNGVAEQLNLDQRIRAALAAVRAEDMATLKNLYVTAPQRTYTQTDANFCDTMDAAENVSLRVDRAFGRALAERWKATFLCCVGTGDDLDNADPERLQGIALAWCELMAIVVGCGMAAERLGLATGDFLAFSAWHAEGEWQNVENYMAEVVEGPVQKWIDENGQRYADALLEIWRSQRGRVPAVQ